MKLESWGSTVLWIELWHAFLLVAVGSLLVSLQVVEPWALWLGGLFMGVNFFFLSCGVRWVLTPFATKGRVRAGLFLLLLKFGLFLAVVSAFFFRVRLDAPSFAVGTSSLLVAIVMQRLSAVQREAE